MGDRGFIVTLVALLFTKINIAQHLLSGFMNALLSNKFDDISDFCFNAFNYMVNTFNIVIIVIIVIINIIIILRKG